MLDIKPLGPPGLGHRGQPRLSATVTARVESPEGAGDQPASVLTVASRRRALSQSQTVSQPKGQSRYLLPEPGGNRIMDPGDRISRRQRVAPAEIEHTRVGPRIG